MDAAHAIPARSTIKPDGSATANPATRRMVDADLPKALDMSHHLSELAKHRQLSALKELYRYASVPGMLVLAGGIPHPDIFPFEELSAQTLPVDHIPLDLPRTPASAKKGLLSWLFGTKHKTDHLSIPKYVSDAKPETIQLSTSLQYQTATGPPALPAFLREYVQRIYKPAYADWDVLINVGATDAWGKVCNLLLEVGDAILVEEWTYPGAEGAFLPMQCEMVAVKMDGQGAIPEHLDQVLSEWDEEKRGKKRPRVFYTIPTGQNPSGATAMEERKRAIYKVAQKWDIIICEDEPYYCLYVGEWIPKNKEKSMSMVQREQIELEKQEGSKGNEAYIKALPPTYLTIDTDGRVIRMDTFSKTSCPGSRLGWITSSPIFIERLTRATEASTQAPSGFATALTTTMLQNWGMEGYIRWLRGIKSQYKQRRDWICDAFEDVFHIEVSSGGLNTQEGGNRMVMDVLGYGTGVTCYARPAEGSGQAKWDEKRGVMGKVGKPLVSFIPPTAGMFIFLAIHLSSHPSYAALSAASEDADKLLMDKIWRELADNKVLFAPGWGFDARGEHNIGGAGSGVGYFRLSYSVATYEQVGKAVRVLKEVLVKTLGQE